MTLTDEIIEIVAAVNPELRGNGRMTRLTEALKPILEPCERDRARLEWLGKRGFDWRDNPPEGWVYTICQDIRAAIDKAMEADH